MVDRRESRNPVEVLAEEFIERQRRGDHPTVAEYAEAHPELADTINDLFPGILVLEQVRRHSLSCSPRPVELRVERLEQLGDYRILREIGRGGMGIVYEAEQQSLGRRVAVKVFPHQVLGDSRHLERFHREARTAALLHHSNIVQVFGVGEQDGLSYYVMQLIHGVSLDKVIDELRRTRYGVLPSSESEIPSRLKNHDTTRRDFFVEDAVNAVLRGEFLDQDSRPGCCSNFGIADAKHASLSLLNAVSATTDADSLAEEADVSDNGESAGSSANASTARAVSSLRSYWRNVAEIGVQVGDALRYAHTQGTLHRDIKPANLLLDSKGTIWITDFGLAKAVVHEELSQSGDIVGTLRYMAPEQLRGHHDPRTDVYSLGVTLYELLTLRPAFADTDEAHLMQRVYDGAPPSPRSLQANVPRDLETIVLKAIAGDPRHRYQSAGDLTDDLRRYLDDRPIRARRVGLVERFWRWSRRNPAIAVLSVVLLLVIAGSFSVVGWEWREAEMGKRRVQEENRRAEANLSLALDSMDEYLDQFEATWMAHPREPRSEEEEADLSFRMAVSASTAAVLENALQFYHQFAEQNERNPRLQRDTAKAYRRVGEIHNRLGQYAKAEHAYREAIAIYTRQMGQLPATPELATLTAATLNELAKVLRLDGRLEEARPHLEHAENVLVDELERSGNSSECRYELARTCSNLGDVSWRLMRPMQAGVYHRRAKELLETLVQEVPQKAEYRLALARAYRTFLPFPQPETPGRDAAWYRSEAVAILEGLVDDFPEVPDYPCELSETLAMPRPRFGEPGNGFEVRAGLQRAVSLARQIAEEYPTVPRYRAALASATHQLGWNFYASKRKRQSEKHFREAAAIYANLHREFPSIDAYRFFLAMALHAQGIVLRDLERLGESRDVLELAITQQQAYLEAHPGVAFGESTLARLLDSQAETLRKSGMNDLAVEKTEEAQAIRAKIKGRFQNNDNR